MSTILTRDSVTLFPTYTKAMLVAYFTYLDLFPIADPVDNLCLQKLLVGWPEYSEVQVQETLWVPESL